MFCSLYGFLSLTVYIISTLLTIVLVVYRTNSCVMCCLGMLWKYIQAWYFMEAMKVTACASPGHCLGVFEMLSLSRYLQFPLLRVPFTKEKMPVCPCHQTEASLHASWSLPSYLWNVLSRSLQFLHRVPFSKVRNCPFKNKAYRHVIVFVFSVVLNKTVMYY